jgi:predicted N-acetyltransferase YhbS
MMSRYFLLYFCFSASASASRLGSISVFSLFLSLIMPLEVLPITEDDVPDWAALHYAAFSPTTIGVLWQRPYGRESMSKLAEALKASFPKPESFVFKCVDTELDNKLIAIAKWAIYEQQRSAEEVDKAFAPRPTMPEDNVEARAEFMQGIYKARQETVGGQPHVILEVLICHPDHQKRGAGRKLIQWGLDKADDLELPLYLEGSLSGVRLYRSVGFEAVGEIHFDSTKYGGDKPDVHTVSISMARKDIFLNCVQIMIRQPKTAPT